MTKPIPAAFLFDDLQLGRLVGISTQQIRNYADAGILPPAPRTRAGYRRFDARHRRACSRTGLS
ncbi:MAG: MerR family DNA-binding transcriptional regulator [Pseudonocardiaceae bacterium]